ncbi:putative lactate 2-monooxygenase PB1A11.03 [Fusarium oxysporum f. sp. albedinis]|nr:putative lactate 2-monooxygenase PB1A11.03 [Fusarium oxysporum f. sp. albedinis]
MLDSFQKFLISGYCYESDLKIRYVIMYSLESFLLAPRTLFPHVHIKLSRVIGIKISKKQDLQVSFRSRLKIITFACMRKL